MSSLAAAAASVGPSKSANIPSPVCFTRRPPCLANTCVDDAVVDVELVAPVFVSRCAELFRRADDIGEQHGGEDPLTLCVRGYFAERQNLLDQYVGDVECMVLAWGKLGEPRIRKTDSQRLRSLEWHHVVATSC